MLEYNFNQYFNKILTKMSKYSKLKTQGSKPAMHSIGEILQLKRKYVKIFGLIEENLKTIKKLKKM